MDLGRYALQQEGVYTSALKGYPCHAVHEADFRVGGTDCGRMFDRELSRDVTYPWNGSLRQIHDRDTYADSYRGIDSYRHQGFDMPARFAGRNHAGFSPYDDGCDYRRREDRHERDTEYGWSNYGSDFDKSSKRDGSWRRYDFRVRDRDKQISSRERDPCPESFLSRGHDDHRRSRSPRVSSRWKEYDDRQNHEHSSMVPSATVKVTGLSSNTTQEDLYRILAKWRPFGGVRVVKEKESGSCRGFAFIHFPSVVAARIMMEEVGYDGLVDDGRELSFEYSFKKVKTKYQLLHGKLRKSKIRRQRAIERAAFAAPAQQQQQEEEKDFLAEEEGEEDDGEVVEAENIGVEEEGVEAGEAKAETEDLLQVKVEEVQQQQHQQVGEGELETGDILHGPSLHIISASISCEELAERMDRIKEDPCLKVVIEDIEIGGPAVMMRYLSDPEVLQKLGHAFGLGASEGILNSTEHNASDDDEDETDRG
ncbi:hypothetical protein MKW94_026866 [Papaver nudicaule]|uniref:RRM domain-containing protein n=1 Tax=Papaver nudicaule TaxID=74823 RepID=A0AA41RLA1_PAPNU|nr:hypothetical protein [Papaver nudicaule]